MENEKVKTLNDLDSYKWFICKPPIKYPYKKESL